MEIGLGTWQNTDPKVCKNSVKHALDIGYNHIDTAQAYKNEVYVGEGIAASQVDRNEVFLASKVWISNLSPQNVISSTKESLENLGTDYIDLMYVHWPAGDFQVDETLNAFRQLKEKGLIKNIGISNFEIRQIEAAKEAVDIYANQIEMHPLLQQKELREYCTKNDIEVVSYSPLARGEVFNIPEIKEIAEKYDASEAQVSLAWIMEKGATPIPKASSKDHIEENLKAKDLELEKPDIEEIDSINIEKRMVDPRFAPW